MPIEAVNDDPIRHYSTQEEQRLANHLLMLVEQVRLVDCKAKEYSIDLICGWHKLLFERIRDHAGRYRSADYGEDHLTFGPHRSVARADVPASLDIHVRDALGLCDQLSSMERRWQREKFIEELIKAALYVHADLIRIHPFRDGNGRVGRLVINYFLCRWDVPPVSFESPKQEYYDCMNHYYVHHDLDRLVDLTLRLMNNQLGAM